MLEVTKAVAKSGSGSILFVLLGLVFAKLLAVTLGPEGVGLYTVVSLLIQTTITFATVAGSVALIQGIASRQGRDREGYLGTVFWIYVIGTLLVTAFLLLTAPWIASRFSSGNQVVSAEIVRWMIIPVLWGVAQGYLVSMINGYRAIGQLVTAQVLGSAVQVVIVYPVALIVTGGNSRAILWLLSGYFAVQVFYIGWLVYRRGWFNDVLNNLLHLFDWGLAKTFFSMSSMIFLTAQTSNLVLLLMASIMTQQYSLMITGIFNTAWGLSVRYIGLILGSFSPYYLPALSGIHHPPERSDLINNILRIATLAGVLLITSVIALKPFIVRLLYSEEFIPSLQILRWMLMGDFIKVAVVLTTTPMIAYSRVKVHFTTEAIFYIGMLVATVGSVFFLQDIQGIGAAYSLLYVPYLIFNIYYIKAHFGYSVSKRVWTAWVIGLAIIIGSSLFFWNATTVNWVWATLWISIAGLFCVFTLSARERNKVIATIRIWAGVGSK